MSDKVLKEDYLARTYRELGPVNKVVRDAHGKVVDGFHRLKVNPKWPSEKNMRIKTESQRILARLISHNARRDITVEERQSDLEALAKALEREGHPKHKISSIISKTAPFDDAYIRHLLGPEWKQKKGFALQREKEAYVHEARKRLEEAKEGLEVGKRLIERPAPSELLGESAVPPEELSEAALKERLQAVLDCVEFSVVVCPKCAAEFEPTSQLKVKRIVNATDLARFLP